MSSLTRQEYNQSKRSFASIIVLMSPFLVFDWLEVYARFYASDIIGRLACFVLPFATLSQFLVPHRLSAYAHIQCTAQVGEPALSIIFFMLKLTLAWLTGFVMTLWVYVVPSSFLPQRLFVKRSDTLTRIRDTISRDGGPVQHLIKTLPIVFVVLLFSLVAVYHSRSQQSFGISIADKVIEDGISFTIFIAALITSGVLLSCAYYWFNQLSKQPVTNHLHK